MYDPHASNDTKEEEDEHDYEKSDCEREDSGSPVALIAGHVRVLPWVGTVNVSFLNRILVWEERRAYVVVVIRLKLGSGVADLALPWGSPLSRICLAMPAL